MSKQQPDISTQLQETKARLKLKISIAQELISSAQNQMVPERNRFLHRSVGYCDHGLLLRQEYGFNYDPGMDMVDLMDVDC